MKLLLTALLLACITACSGGGGGGGDDDGDGVNVPSALELLGYLSYPGDLVGGVALSGTSGYVSRSGLLEVINVSDPLNPSVLGNSTSPISPGDVAVAGTTAYVADGEDIRVFDVSNPLDPTSAVNIARADSVMGFDVANGILYAAEYQAGIAAFSLVDPLSPLLLGSADTPGDAHSLVVLGGTAYVGDGTQGLQIVNVSDPSGMTLRGLLPPPGEDICGTRYLGCHGIHCLLSQCFADPQVVDVSNPDAPAVVGVLDFTASTTRAWMGDGFGLIARGTFLKLVDLRNPASPAELDEWDLGSLAGGPGGAIVDIAVEGDLVAVGGDEGFALFRLLD